MDNTLDRIITHIRSMSNKDLRVGQIMSNVFYDIAESGQDPFYVKDGKLLEYLEKHTKS
jgi:hypothetical protein